MTLNSTKKKKKKNNFSISIIDVLYRVLAYSPTNIDWKHMLRQVFHRVVLYRSSFSVENFSQNIDAIVHFHCEPINVFD